MTFTKPVINISNKLYAKAENIIPSGTQTLAKGPTQYVDGVAPKYLHRGKGAYVWDVDGNKYLDLNMGIGPIILGYCYKKVDLAISNQLSNGITFSLMHPLELEIAEKINALVPNAEQIRFSKTGCDVTSAAIRLARAFTGREKILTCGYHGWHDWTIGTTSRNAGIPKDTLSLTNKFNYNDIDSLSDQIESDIAAVIMEPMLFEFPKDDFLHKVRELCNKFGVVLIFDEMWTGFRLSPGGAQQYFGVNADLATFSKAVANGMPLSVLTGKAEIMENLDKDVFFYTTFGGEALSLAAAGATIDEIKDKDVCSRIENLGNQLIIGINNCIAKLDISFAKCIGMGARSLLSIDPRISNSLLIKSLIQQELVKRGILWQGSNVISYSHNIDDIKYIIKAYQEILPLVDYCVTNSNVDDYLEGKPMQPIFRTTSGK